LYYVYFIRTNYPEYIPASTDIEDINETINVKEMVKFASDILSGKEGIALDGKKNLTYS